MKLRKLDDCNSRRQQIANIYLKELKGVEQIVLPYVPEWAEPVWHLFVIRTPKRDALQKHLEQNGIQTLIHYPVPPHKQQAYQEMNHLTLPITESIHQEVLSLPMGPTMKKEETMEIVGTIKVFYKNDK